MSDIHKSFLEPFFIEMNKKFDKEWCVLHSYESLPNYSESDVDMAFSGADINALEELILTTAKTQGWTVYQKLWYDSEQCFYYVLKENNNDIELAIDFLIDRKGVGKYGFETTKLTSDCNRWNEIVPIPNSSVAFSYKLVKRVVKHRDLSLDNEYLLNHFNRANISEIYSILENQFGKEGLNLLVPYLDKKDFSISKNDRNQLMSMKKKNRFARFYWETQRVFNRIVKPCGMIISLPEVIEDDEKKQLVKELETRVGLLFRFVRYQEKAGLFFKFKSLIGSTLVIESSNVPTVKKHWTSSEKVIEELSDAKKKTVNDLSESYYNIILKTFKERKRFKEL
jgi:hypothetical protein